MNRRMKQLIQEAYTPPTPRQKDEFIRSYRKMQDRPSVNTWNMLLTQAAYIRKSVWLVTACAFLLGILQIHTANMQTVAVVSAAMPFVSGFAVLESFRSKLYHMEELEGATKEMTLPVL